MTSPCSRTRPWAWRFHCIGNGVGPPFHHRKSTAEARPAPSSSPSSANIVGVSANAHPEGNLLAHTHHRSVIRIAFLFVGSNRRAYRRKAKKTGHPPDSLGWGVAIAVSLPESSLYSLQWNRRHNCPSSFAYNARCSFSSFANGLT